MKKLLAVLVLSLVLFACSEQESALMNEKVDPANLVALIKKIQADKSIDGKNLSYLMNAIGRLNSDSTLKNKTVGELIQNQIETDREIISNNLFTKANLTEMGQALKINILGAGGRQNDAGQDFNQVRFEITNNRDKNVKLIQGNFKVQFANNGQLQTTTEAFSLNLQNQTIAPSAKITLDQFYPYNANSPLSQVLRANINKRYVWTPQRIEFEDGTILSLNGQ